MGHSILNEICGYKMSDTLIAITVYGANTFVEKCLDSILQNTPSISSDDIYVFHNKAQDDTEFKVKAIVEQRGCKYNSSPVSLHMAQSVNNALRPAFDKEYNYVVYCNDDIAPPKPSSMDWLSAMKSFLDARPEYGIISPMWDDRCGTWNPDNTKNLTPGVQGFCLMFRKTLLNALKNNNGYVFNEQYPLMWEDCELLYRIHKLGFKSGIYDSIPFYHFGSQTVSTIRESQTYYQTGKALFHQMTGAPTNVTQWTVSNAIYCYKMKPEENWTYFGVV